MNTNIVYRTFFLTLALGAALLSGAYATANAQYLYFPNNTTISVNEGSHTAIVGYPNGSDFSSGTHATSPTIDVVSGAAFGSGGSLQAYNSSVVNVSGGNIGGAGIFALDSSIVNITGGTISEAMTYDSGTINVYAGATIPGAVWAQSGGTVNVYGGSIGSSTLDAFAQGTGNTLNVYGGKFVSGQIFVDDGATLSINGGYSFRIIGYDYFNGVRSPIYTPIRYVVSATLISSNATLSYNGSVTGGWKEYQLSGQLGDGTNVSGVKVYVANDGSVFNVTNPSLFY